MSKISKVLLIVFFAIALSFTVCYGIDLNLTANSTTANPNNNTPVNSVETNSTATKRSIEMKKSL